MNEILSCLNFKSNNKYRLLKPNQYSVKKIIVDKPLKIKEYEKDPIINLTKKMIKISIFLLIFIIYHKMIHKT